MNAIRRCLVIGLFAMFSLSAMAIAHVSAQDPPLLSMLAQVPEVGVSHHSGWATVRYVDYAALASAEGVAPLRALGDVDLLLTTVPLGAMLGRIMAGPEALSYLYASAGNMADAVGFEWLVDVDRSLEFGDPPSLGVLLHGSFDRERICAALEGRGFAREDVAGVPVWHRFEDLTISLPARDVGDPFGGSLGAAARIALLGDGLANARSWALIEAMIASSHGEQPSLADDTGYRALAEAITTTDGWLIQALFFTGDALRLSGDPAQTDLEPGADESESLPTFSLVVLADRQEGDEQVHVIGLVCADVPTAQVAGKILSRRLRELRLPLQADAALVEQFGATVGSSVVERAQYGLAVALVEARYPLPSPRIDPDTGQFNASGLLYRAWVRAIMFRGFTPLW